MFSNTVEDLCSAVVHVHNVGNKNNITAIRTPPPVHHMNEARHSIVLCLRVVTLRVFLEESKTFENNYFEMTII